MRDLKLEVIIMSEKYTDILSRNLDVPEIVQEKMKLAFSKVYEEEKEAGRRKKRKQISRMRRLPRAAVIAFACCLALGMTAAAMGLTSLYRQRMQEMTEDEVDRYYNIANGGEANSHNRNFTLEEEERYAQLETEYQRNGLFPQNEITCLYTGDIYGGEGVAIDPDTRTVYLPDRELTDEELLEIIDFNCKVAYSIYEKNNERILSGDDWESRMATMTDEMVDEVYLAWCGGNTEVSGGYSRPLTEAEERRYAELNQKYETEGLYVESNLSIIQAQSEYTGSGVAFSVKESHYCIPDGELTDEELLKVIDFNHKVPYCFDRINTEILLGLREGYPQIQ